MKKYLKISMLGFLLLGSSFLLTGCTLKNSSDEDNVEIVDLDDDNSENTEDSSQDTEEEETNDTENVDYTNFSEDTQVVGEESDAEYGLTSLSDESLTGYHKFTFVMSSDDEGAGVPYVNAEYKSSLGSIRIVLNQTTSDNSGIAYQGSRSINVEGISRIYHNISSNQTEELYDIGVSESTPFYLYSEEVSAGVWNVILEVKYPGESTLDIDLGSTELSSEDQSISGSVASDGAAVTGYSYSVSGGQLIFVWSVKGSSSNPIPSVSASLGDDGILNVAFESLEYDKVSGSASSISLPGSIGFTYSSGAYHFEVGADATFKLSASTNPNQVELTVDL